METSDSFAYVRFVSDTSGNAAGFSLSFEASTEGKIIFKRLLGQDFLLHVNNNNNNNNNTFYL